MDDTEKEGVDHPCGRVHHLVDLVPSDGENLKDHIIKTCCKDILVIFVVVLQLIKPISTYLHCDCGDKGEGSGDGAVGVVAVGEVGDGQDHI